MAEMNVTVLSKEVIVPSSPTPTHLKTYNLSCLDQCWPPHYFPFILCYSYDHESTNIYKTPSNMTIRLKTSLSNTLTRFYPLAGRLSKDRNTVDCTDEGVQFLVARVESSRLSDFVKNPTSEQVKKLTVGNHELPFADEPLAIQVNMFDCGGMVVGVSALHKIGDACSFSSFVSQWIEIAKGSADQITSPALMRPFFDSAVLFPPMDDQSAHTLCNQNQKDPSRFQVAASEETLVTKRFIFSSLTINKLKYQLHNTMQQAKPPSKVEVVTALIWKCGTEAFGDCKASVASHVVNFWRKMVPSLQDHQFGNLIQMATTTVVQQTELEDMASLVAKLRASFGKIDSEYLKTLTGKNRVEIATLNFIERNKYMTDDQKVDDVVKIFKFNSWCKLGFTRNNFGWGKPIWVGCTGNPYNEIGIFLIDSVRDDDDGIEAWVTLSLDNMHKFEHNAELQQFFG